VSDESKVGLLDVDGPRRGDAQLPEGSFQSKVPFAVVEQQVRGVGGVVQRDLVQNPAEALCVGATML